MSGASGEEFDMSAAVAEVGGGLGFDSQTDEGGNDVNLNDGGVDDAGVDATGTGTAADGVGAGEGAGGSENDPAATLAFVPQETHKHLFNEQGLLRTWRPEAAAEFAKLSPTVQSEILKREEDIFKGIEGYKEAAAFGNSLKQVLDPYMPVLQKYGIRPDAQVADMMQAHYTLAFGSQQEKLALLQQVVKDYRIDLGQLQPEDQGYVDPQVQGLQTQLKELQSQLSQTQQMQLAEKRSAIERHVAAFAQDQKNVYFEEVANDIAHLLRTGAEKTVEAAYEKAIWMNPAVRAKELARQQAEKLEKERKDATEKAEAARKATAVNVRSQAKRGSAAAPLGSMDDTLAETLASINKRS